MFSSFFKEWCKMFTPVMNEVVYDEKQFWYHIRPVKADDLVKFEKDYNWDNLGSGIPYTSITYDNTKNSSMAKQGSQVKKSSS